MIDPTLSVANTATKMMFAAYSGYQKGKLANSDQGLREEVRRRAEAVKEMLHPLHKNAHRKKLRSLRSEIQEVMDLCDEFASSAKYSISHTPNSQHDAAVQLKKKSLKILVEHDFNTHQNDNRVLSSEYTDQSNTEKERTQTCNPSGFNHSSSPP